MAKITLNKQFLQDSLGVIKQRGLKGLLLGHQAELNAADKELIASAAETYNQTKMQGSKKGSLIRVDAIHKGSGDVYLLPGQNGKVILVCSADTRVTNGPDLWVYLSTSDNPKKSLGTINNLGLIKGTKGGQIYGLKATNDELKTYRSVIIYCKQFEVLFSYAILK